MFFSLVRCSAKFSIFCHFKFSPFVEPASHAASLDFYWTGGFRLQIKRKDKSLRFILRPQTRDSPVLSALQVPLPETCGSRLRTFIMSSEVLLHSSSTVLIPARFAKDRMPKAQAPSMFISRTFSFIVLSFSIITSAVFKILRQIDEEFQMLA